MIFFYLSEYQKICWEETNTYFLFKRIILPPLVLCPTLWQHHSPFSAPSFFTVFFLSFIARKVPTYVWSDRTGKLFLIPISRILPREGSKGRDKSAARIFSVRQWKNRSNGKKHCKSWEGFHRSMCLGRLCMYFGYWDCRSVSE